jgi:cytoskeletal protein CcmA (bactofilin family)
MATRDGRTRDRGEKQGATFIGPLSRVQGRIRGEGDLTVAGRIEGDIAISGDLVVLDSGVLTSQVEASDVSVAGELTGDIDARGVVRIQRGARVRGDVRGRSFSIEDGAEFSGSLDADFDLPPELGQAQRNLKRR